MANVISNRKNSSLYPQKFNKRENRASTHNFSCAITDAALELQSDDGINFIRNTGEVTITLPPAAENTGRCISFLQVDAEVLTIAQNADGANIDGADADFDALDAADDWVELYCTGEEWIIVKQSIA
jgi:hypothetical protein